MTKQKRTHKTAKVLLSLAVAGALVGSVFAGCSAGKSDKGNKNATAGVTGSITVVSREEGSGTRGAFVELTGVEDRRLTFTARMYDEKGEVGSADHERFIVDNARFQKKADAKAE